MIVLWLSVMVYSYHIYTQARHNHFEFRYWFVIGFFTVFQLVLAGFYVMGVSVELQSVRWLAFIFIDIMLIEIFIRSIHERHYSILVRMLLYFMIVANQTSNSEIHLVILAVSLMILASISQCAKVRRYFVPAFILYALVNASPDLFGATTIQSMSIGAMYSTAVAIGIYQMYHNNKCLYQTCYARQTGQDCDYQAR